MDPLSIITGALAVAQLAAATCDAFSTLRSICKTLPGRLHALNNEVVDIELVLNQVAKVVEDRASSPISEAGQANIPQLLKRADAKLNELKVFIERLIKTSDRTNAKLPPLFGAFAFQKQQGRLAELQEDIKTVKCSLNIMLGASNSYAHPALLIPLLVVLLDPWHC
jgi:hypothetical protein